MPNPHRGEVSFVAGEQTYTLSFSVNSICSLEDELGEGWDAIASQLRSTPRVKTVRAVLWAGLLDKHEGLEIEDAGRIMTEAGVAETMEAVGRALIAAFPAPKEEKAAGSRPTKRAAAGTGSPSARITQAPALTPNASGG